MRKPLQLILLISLLGLIIGSCKKIMLQPDNLPDSSEEEFLDEPIFRSGIANRYSEISGLDSNLVILGRVLFYDRKLSANNKLSCGTCHKQENAFASPEKFDKGADGKLLSRNTPSIQDISAIKLIPVQINTPNQSNQKNIPLFWDGRQNNLANMVLNPVLNHNEMNFPSFGELVKKLEKTSYYNSLFSAAYKDGNINIERIAFSLESFIVCIQNDSDKKNHFNQFGAQNNGMSTSLLPPVPIENKDELLTPEEKLGKRLFHNVYNCAKCHDQSATASVTSTSNYGGGNVSVEDNPSIISFFNIGLDKSYKDNGLGEITGNANHKGLFKVPTLKNIAKTAPYMHDGRFKTLYEVIGHYSEGIKDHPNLSSQFRNADGTIKNLNISSTEKLAIVAFLNTLNDNALLSHSRYSNPFVKN